MSKKHAEELPIGYTRSPFVRMAPSRAVAGHTAVPRSPYWVATVDCRARRLVLIMQVCGEMHGTGLLTPQMLIYDT
jgi:hypothetical protein